MQARYEVFFVIFFPVFKRKDTTLSYYKAKKYKHKRYIIKTE